MSRSVSFQENVYNTYKLLKSDKNKKLFLEKCFVFAWENREIEANYEVDLAFSGVKPSLKLRENGGGRNNSEGKNQFSDQKNEENGKEDKENYQKNEENYQKNEENDSEIETNDTNEPFNLAKEVGQSDQTQVGQYGNDLLYKYKDISNKDISNKDISNHNLFISNEVCEKDKEKTHTPPVPDKNEIFADYEFCKKTYEEGRQTKTFDFSNFDEFWVYWKDKGLLKSKTHGTMTRWDIQWNKDRPREKESQPRKFDPTIY